MLNLNVLKKEIFDEHNRIRKNPKAYIPLLEKQLEYFKGNVMYKPDDPVGIMTQEGPAAFKECIKFLKSQAPVKELTLNISLSRAAQDHANDIGPKGLTDHIGSDNSEPADRIEKYLTWDITIAENLDFGGKSGEEILVSLIVDDGVKNRGHRANIFKDDIKYIGIGLSKHNSDYEVCTIMTYVGDITDEKSKSKNEPSLDTIKVKMSSYSPKKNLLPTSPQKDVKVEVKKETKPETKKDSARDKKTAPAKKKKGGPKKENFFGPKLVPYNLAMDEDKPKGAVDCKSKTFTKKINGVCTKTTIRTYKMKDGAEVVLEIEEVNQ